MVGKRKFPYRLGTTSYIIPADILPNVAHLARRVDDIELVLFESETVSSLPDASIIDALNHYRTEYRLSYTVHLPLDIDFGCACASRRRASLDQCRRIFERTAPLEPFGYIIHFNGGPDDNIPQHDLSRWQETVTNSVHTLVRSDVAPSKLCVENLAYPYEWAFEIVRRCGLSVCLDIGHLLRHGRNIEAHFDRYFDHCRVIHLHGVEKETDHMDITHLPPGLLADILERLEVDADCERILTLEIFNEKKFEASMACLDGRKSSVGS